MTLEKLYTILNASGYPVAYSHFENPPKPPYIIYLMAYSSNFHADNNVYKKIENVQIELYTNKKDLVAERNLEEVLNNNAISYECIETYIESEKLFQRIYEIGVI